MMSASYEVIPGADVVTMDGDKIGTVSEVRGEYFKVEAAMQPDYWLDKTQIESASDIEVRLSFDKGDLDRYKMGEPEAA